MDDFNVHNLHDSKNEWAARLVNVLCPLIFQGFKAILQEAIQLCEENDEEEKYLMTFQNFIAQIPKWNEETIDTEVKRIIEQSNCTYLEDLITCVHVIQLKILSCIRVGQEQKKIEMDIPKLNNFVHKIYINISRKLYTTVYLFDVNIESLIIQKNNREFELIIKEGIMNTIREDIPIETILRAYLEETEEEEFVEQPPPPISAADVTDVTSGERNRQSINPISTAPSPIPSAVGIASATGGAAMSNIGSADGLAATPTFAALTPSHSVTPVRNPIVDTNDSLSKSSSLTFQDIDNTIDSSGKEEDIYAPKDIETLEAKLNSKISNDGGQDDDGDDEKIKIFSDVPIQLDNLDVQSLDRPISTLPDPILNDIEILS